MDAQNLTILYERLSVDDEKDGESNSIKNQRALLEDYAERNNMKPYIHLSDDGYSGTGWNRPGWQKVIEEVEKGNVRTIVFKDLSRFGRDHLRVGLYMEMFHERGIRLIMVNDGIDTAHGEDDFTPFRAIISEWYARDCSRKVKSSLQSKGKAGKPLSTKPPYGYIKDPANKDKWLVDEEAAAVVRRVFNLTIDGKGSFEICRILHDEKVERPSYYLAKRGYIAYHGALETADPYLWGTQTITFMLSRLEYAGHTVNFRTVKPSYKSKRQVPVPKDEWLIFENTHKAIISQGDWDLVQKLRLTKKRTDTVGEANPLNGLIFCADCGNRLYNHRKRIDHYTCSGYVRGRQNFADKHCSPHYVATQSLRDLVLDVIQKTCGYVRENEADFVENMRERSTLRQGETVKTHTRRIAQNELRISNVDKLFQSLYEDKVSGVITADRFAQMSENFEREQADLRAENALLRQELEAFKADSAKADSFVKLVHKFTRFEELTTPMIHEFIDKIVIHESIWTEQTETDRRKGTRTQEIEIFLKHIGNFTAPDTRSPEEIEAELIAEEKLQRKRQQKRDSERRRREKQRTLSEPKPAA
jgi:DNA invertase Pin-like site-specific DNA recombinase